MAAFRFGHIWHIDGELKFRSSASSPGRVLPDVKTERSAVVAGGAEAGVGAAPGAAAAGTRGAQEVVPALLAAAAAADPLIAWGCC